MSLTSSVRLAIQGVQQNTVDLGSSSARRTVELAISLAAGTGAGQADLVFADTRTLAASGTEDLDLAGALADAFGVAQVFARVKAIAVKAATGNTNNVQVTRPASNGLVLFMAAGDGIALRPGQMFATAVGAADATGIAVTAATGDLLTITNSAGSTTVSYDIVIIGCSA